MRVRGLAKNLVVRWPYTQADIADATGLSDAHVNRSLRRLRQEGLIRLTRTELTILDWDGLARSGGFDSDYLLVYECGSRR